MATRKNGYRNINEKYKKLNDEIRQRTGKTSGSSERRSNTESGRRAPETNRRRAFSNTRRQELLEERKNIKHEDDFGKTIRLTPEMIERERQRILREKQKKKKQMQDRRRRIFLGIIAVFLIIIIILIGRNILARAGSKKVQEAPPNLITQNPGKSNGEGTTLVKFNRANEVTPLYKEASKDGVVAEVPKDSYLENHGVTGEFTKVVLNGQKGYVLTDTLFEIQDEDQFKVEKGLLFVNDQYYLPSDYSPGLNEDAKQSFELMVQDAEKNHIVLKSASDFRTYDQQEKLYKENSDIGYMKPGHSEHQAGLAYDVMGEDYNLKYKEGFKDSKEFSWLEENAHKYGFVLRYPQGKETVTAHKFAPWQWRYVGIKAATEMRNNKLTLEEYLKITAQPKAYETTPTEQKTTEDSNNTTENSSPSTNEDNKTGSSTDTSNGENTDGGMQ